MRTWEEKPDVTSSAIEDNQTWNTCPRCDKSWKDEISIPGLIHRTRLCQKCIKSTEKHDSRRT